MKQVLYWILLLLLFAVLLFPIYLMISNSLSPIKGFLRSPPRLTPYEWTLDNYRRAFALPHLPRWIANTLFLAVMTIVGGVLINGAAGYAFCFCRVRWLKYIFWAFMLPIFVSGYVLIIAQIQIVTSIGLSGIPAVVSMGLFWSVGIFLFRNYFRTIPHEIVEVARIDGAAEWRILLQVVLPMSRPIIGAAVVFLGMGVLGGFVWQMLNLQAIETRTYLVGLMATTLDVYAVKNIGYDLTVGTLLFLPYLALFAVSSRYFVKGLTGGALKG